MKKEAIEILCYYNSTRKAGHTKAIQEIEGVVVVIGDSCPLKFKSETVELSKFGHEMSGKNIPIIFDNSAIVQLLNGLR